MNVRGIGFFTWFVLGVSLLVFTLVFFSGSNLVHDHGQAKYVVSKPVIVESDLISEADDILDMPTDPTSFFQRKILLNHNLPMYQRQKQRTNAVKRWCKHQKPASQNTPVEPSHGKEFKTIKFGPYSFTLRDLNYTYVNEDLKMMYCIVPKVGCTNWKRLFVYLTGKLNVTRLEDISGWDVHRDFERKYLKRLSQYNYSEIKIRLQTYYKMMFVRDPFERLLSAFRNKLGYTRNPYWKEKLGRHIIRMYRQNPSNRSLMTGHDVTFPEFVKYLLEISPRDKRTFDMHWKPYQNLCHPCKIKYNFIGKYETFGEDVDYVFKQLNLGENIKLPTPHPNRLKTADMLEDSFKTVSTNEIHRLWSMYQEDFGMFGYDYPLYGMSVEPLSPR